jgi:hypothetical protein
MKHRSFIALAVALVTLLGFAAAVYAYDSGRKDQIAKGVSVAGIDIGGMTRARAESKLRRELAEPLERPLVVRYHDKRFRLSAKRAKVRVDVKGIVSEAVDKSRGGSIITRAWRGLTGGSVDAQLDPRVTYSRAAVNRLVTRVTSTLDRQPQDASLSFSGSGFSKVDSQPGVEVKSARLRATSRSGNGPARSVSRRPTRRASGDSRARYRLSLRGVTSGALPAIRRARRLLHDEARPGRKALPPQALPRIRSAAR